ncbi:MAG: 16S rRNA (cytidine(1402)-2'-O)-methyltransferase, partial [Verrucomicrobiae bacterium]
MAVASRKMAVASRKMAVASRKMAVAARFWASQVVRSSSQLEKPATQVVRTPSQPVRSAAQPAKRRFRLVAGAKRGISPPFRGFYQMNPIYFPPVLCFSLGMDAVLPPLTASTLYLVATPIGNLEDITLRALRVLRECDVVAAEDTRHSGQLLKHFGISKPLLSYFQFNEARRSEEIIERLRRGEKVALVTDAGSPGISDPGERVVKAAIAAGFRVEAVVGACALVGALTASGLPTEEFYFVGFLPHKSGQRRNKLESLKTIAATLVFYESPYRIEKLLGELNEVFPERDVVLARELTKKFEEFLRGKPAQLLEIAQKRSLKGEFVVMVDGPP